MKKAVMIGCGGIGRYHLKHLVTFKDIELAGFCELISERAEAFAAEAPGGRAAAFTDFRKMYDAVDPDMVFVCVPPSKHGEIEFETIDRNIPMFVEKPIALDMGLARQILAKIEEKKLITAVGFQCRYDDINEPAIRFVGERPAVTVEASRVGGVPRVEWWRVKALSGGQLTEQAIHQVDMLRLLFGEAESAYSVARRGFVTEGEFPGYDTDDTTTSVIKFKSGLICTMMTGCYSTGPLSWDSKITVGSRGARMEYRLCESTTVYEPANEGGAGQSVVTYRSGVDFGTLCDRTFVDAAISGDGSKIRSPYSDAIKTLEITLACTESIKTGLPVNLA